MIELKSISKSLGRKHILSNVSFSVRPGECVGITGPIGAGKSTLLYVLCGLLTPDRGSVTIFGLPLISNQQKIASRINYASSSQRLSGYATVMENLTTYARLYNAIDYRHIILSLCKTCRVSPLILQKKVYRLSSGENSFVNFVKSMLNSPEILFLDEITTHMDPTLTDLVRSHLIKRTIHTRTTILISQNHIEIKRVCTRMILLTKGKIAYDGVPLSYKQFKTHYET